MRDLLPAVRYITLALGDEYPLVARRFALSAAAVLLTLALWAW